MSEIVTIIVSSLSTSGIAGFFTWFFTKKKYNSEVDSLLIANMKESLDFYRTLSDDNKSRLEEVILLNKELLLQNAELLLQNNKLQVQVDELSVKVNSLMKLVCVDLSCNNRQDIEREIKSHTRRPKQKKNIEL